MEKLPSYSRSLAIGQGYDRDCKDYRLFSSPLEAAEQVPGFSSSLESADMLQGL